MRDLYPLVLKPEFSRRPWGARDLAPVYDMHAHPGEEAIGEAWLTGDKCVVINGPLAGQRLSDVLNRFGRDLVGTASDDPHHFPLLIKFLFPREKLSVQVHPDDETAQAMGQPCGKTECWYVLHADPGAKLALGLKPATTKVQLESAIAENRAEELLNWINVRPGDMFYVDAGTVHAIGPGAILVETQQNSDTTFRLYDYGRPRELHVSEGLKATKLQTAAGKVWSTSLDGFERLVASSWFVVDKFSLSAQRNFAHDGTSVQCLVATQGAGVVEAEGMPPVTIACGDCVVVPAVVREYSIRPQWQLEFLRSCVPASKVAAPITELVYTR